MDVKSMIIDEQANETYLTAKIRLAHPPISVQIGQKHSVLDSFLIDNNVYTWAFICPPATNSLDIQENEIEEKYTLLKSAIKQAKYRFSNGEFNPIHLSTPSIPGLLILDISKESAIETAKMVGQSHFIFSYLCKEAELVTVSYSDK